ncbi:Acetyltransferase involved in cellulose biosynthesis, CelD/BcsL family [Sphingomonas jatrophae]|uniref:Acetyltransferase involved in cellulose biosynthesis, CelD/BcsL family n=1 Tax=Sphingomonas jatrophae TaxID=1166337 RepID=A0A1I6JX05_9SPHN|nr:Acetyltransferase involved in cellulose biosynthesis, CelD/BcsL family [Sphingomonas jatrophae]
MVEVRIFDDLDAVAADAAGALDRGRQASLFDRLDWYRLTLAHAPLRGRPLILRARDGAAAAWLFLMREGARAEGMVSWYSLRFDAPRIGAADACLPALARALADQGIGHVALWPLADTHLAHVFAAAGWRTRLSAASVNRHVAVTDWPTYWAARPGALRETVRRRGRGDPFRLVILDRFDAAAWRDYEAVYARSWKRAEGAPAFLHVLAEQEGAAGTLRLGLGYDGARPVAAQLWLVEGGTATIHKLAHDEADRARSPGTLLSHAMFRHVIEADGVRLIDFGTGDDAYKADWMDEVRPLHRLDAWNPRNLNGLAGLARDVAGKLVRTLRNR